MDRRYDPKDGGALLLVQVVYGTGRERAPTPSLRVSHEKFMLNWEVKA